MTNLEKYAPNLFSYIKQQESFDWKVYWARPKNALFLAKAKVEFNEHLIKAGVKPVKW